MRDIAVNHILMLSCSDAAAPSPFLLRTAGTSLQALAYPANEESFELEDGTEVRADSSAQPALGRVVDYNTQVWEFRNDSHISRRMGRAGQAQASGH